ncbi:MAG: hypothetical protein Q7T82_03610 [Armatimonadota bacterium]|nr:hypothetical protein [Armatimonadota bacterium]
MADTKRLLIPDACVLIDFCLEDSTLLSLAAASLGRVVVLSPVLSEVRQLSDVEADRLALTVVEPSMELVLNASARRGRLSFRDRLCLLFAKASGGTLYTNDKALLNAARSDGLDARWGLEILLELVSAGELVSQEALRIARSIAGRWRFSSDALIEEFHLHFRSIR